MSSNTYTVPVLKFVVKRRSLAEVVSIAIAVETASFRHEVVLPVDGCGRSVLGGFQGIESIRRRRARRTACWFAAAAHQCKECRYRDERDGAVERQHGKGSSVGGDPLSCASGG